MYLKLLKLLKNNVIMLSVSLIYLASSNSTSVNNVNVYADSLQSSNVVDSSINTIEHQSIAEYDEKQNYESHIPEVTITPTIEVEEIDSTSKNGVKSESENTVEKSSEDEEDPVSIKEKTKKDKEKPVDIVYEYKEFDEPLMYYTTNNFINLLSSPDTNSIISSVSFNTPIQIIGEVIDTDLYYFYINGSKVFIDKNFLSRDMISISENSTYNTLWTGNILNPQSGTVKGPSGKETYYNLNMSHIVERMRGMGFAEEEYPYWIRSDGAKMLGNYIMVAANLKERPRGSFIETSLGMGIVCDTGNFAKVNKYQLDIATNW